MALSRIGSLMVAVSGLVLAAPSMAGIEQGAAPATGGAKRLSEPVRIAALPAQPQVGDAEHGAGKAARSSAILPAQDVPSHALSAQRTAVRLAQAAPLPNGQAVQQGAGRGSSSTSTPGTSSGDVLAPVTDWLEKSAHDFQNVIIRKLSVPTGNAAEAKPQPVKAGETPPAVVPAAPKAATGSGVVAQAPAPAAKPEQPGTGMSGMGGLSGMAGGIADQVNSAIEKAQSWFNDARREFQKDVVKKLEQPETAKPGGMAGQGGAQPTAQIEPPPAAKIEPGKTEAASGQTPADAAKKAADDEAAKRAAEAAANRKLEALAKEEAAARKKAEAEAAAAKKVEEKRLAEEAAARKKAEAEAAAAAKKAEEKRIAEEAAARKKAEAEAAAAKKAEEKRLVEEAAARKKAEADAAAAAKKAEEKRIADEAAAKKADEAAAKAATAAAAAKMAAEASRKADEILKPNDGSGSAAKVTGGGSAAPAPTSPAPTGGSTSSAAVATARRADVAEARGASRRGGRVTHARTCRNAGRKVTPPAVYVVARGDTLWDIAERHYRNGMGYVGVYRANSTKIDDPDLIYPCQKVYLPKLR